MPPIWVSMKIINNRLLYQVVYDDLAIAVLTTKERAEIAANAFKRMSTSVQHMILQQWLH